MFLKCILPLLICINAYAQSDRFLIIKHRIQDKEKVVAEGEIVMIKTFKGERLRGRMFVLTEDLIKVKHKVVPLTNVERVGVQSKLATQIGGAAVSMGVNLVFFGVQNNMRHGWDKTDGSYTASAPFLAFGSAMIVFSRKRKIKNWVFRGQMDGW